MPSDSPNKNLTTENINEVILRILGIEDSDEIDYETYKALLREVMIRGRGASSNIPTEEVEQVTGEWKRIKQKSGRFKVKKSKIRAESFFDTKQKGTATYDKTSAEKYIPKTKQISPVGAIQKNFFDIGDSTVSENLSQVNETLEKIHKSLLLQAAEEKKDEEKDRKDAENKARSLKESRLETVFKGLIKTAETIIKPFRSMLDQLFDYIFNVLLGTTVLKLVDWFNDPKNQDKIKSIQRFLSDHWPKLLGAYLLFGTKFGRFLTSITGTLLKGLARLAIANPAVTAGLAAVGATVGLAALANEVTGQREGAKVQTENKARAQTGKGLGTQGTDTMGDKTPSPGNMGPTTPYGMLQGASKGGIIQTLNQDSNIDQYQEGKPIHYKDISYEDGGQVNSNSGVKITGAGRDTQFIAARPGEVVLTPEDRFKIKSLTGFDVLKYVQNRKPKMVDNIQFANMGGVVGKVAEHLKEDEALSSLSRGINDFIKPGGKSIVSGLNWNMVKPKTPIHSYTDSVGQSTIGWGSTFYDSILQGRKPVRQGDTITKDQADRVLNTNIFNLSSAYSQKIPLWNKMTEDQKAGVLLVGYNAPYGPIGAYPKLTQALKSGDMVKAAANVTRGGPNKQRLSLEKRLLLSGPKNLNQFSESKPKNKFKTKPTQKPTTNIFQQIKEGVMNVISSKPSVNITPQTLASVPSQPPTSKVTTDILPPITVPNGGSSTKSPSSNVNIPDFSVTSPYNRDFTSKVYFS